MAKIKDKNTTKHTFIQMRQRNKRHPEKNVLLSIKIHHKKIKMYMMSKSNILEIYRPKSSISLQYPKGINYVTNTISFIFHHTFV